MDPQNQSVLTGGPNQVDQSQPDPKADQKPQTPAYNASQGKKHLKMIMGGMAWTVVMGVGLVTASRLAKSDQDIRRQAIEPEVRTRISVTPVASVSGQVKPDYTTTVLE